MIISTSTYYSRIIPYLEIHLLYLMTSSINPTYVYVLLLKDGRYYVGKTEDIEKRYQDHSRGKGAAWTSIYPPQSVSEHYIAETKFAEENKTKEYMLRYGIYKVRGGPYSSPVLDNHVVKTIQLQLWHAQDRCFVCGGDHFVSDRKCVEPEKYCCRCGSLSHWASECTQMNDIEGLPIPLGVVRR